MTPPPSPVSVIIVLNAKVDLLLIPVPWDEPCLMKPGLAVGRAVWWCVFTLQVHIGAVSGIRQIKSTIALIEIILDVTRENVWLAILYFCLSIVFSTIFSLNVVKDPCVLGFYSI